MRYMIMNIWDSKSILSKHDDLRDLALIRWDRCTPWSPSNSIILTKEEAELHLKLADPYQTYAHDLVKEISRRQSQGLKYFPCLDSTINHALKHPTR